MTDGTDYDDEHEPYAAIYMACADLEKDGYARAEQVDALLTAARDYANSGLVQEEITTIRGIHRSFNGLAGKEGGEEDG